ncbi:MAG TPA: metallophosphoesterase [Blastocatellia bacterium]|nr:metallophosphoesterase [Blastocatellia bacterium]
MPLSLRGRLTAIAFLLALAFACPATAPVASQSKEALAFAVIGDSGTGQAPQYEVARQMKAYREKVRFDFVLMLGDNIYPHGEAALFKPRFEDPYKDLLKEGVRFYASLGNHDLERGTEAALHYDKFSMEGHRYYMFSKAQGLIDFFALDSSVMTIEQRTWLEAALKASKARWKVAFFHHPIYCSARKHGSDLNLRKHLEPLFVRYKVDAAFAGHDHVYERMKPQKGIYYFTEGASGQLRKGNIDRRSEVFEAGNDTVNSFLVVQVDASKMKVEAVGSNGAILDQVVINKGR